MNASPQHAITHPATPAKVFRTWRIHSIRIDNATGRPTGHAEIALASADGELEPTSIQGVPMGDIYELAAKDPAIAQALVAVISGVFALAKMQNPEL